MNDDLKRRKSDNLLKLALEEEMLQDKEILEFVEGELECPHKFSERHNRRMKEYLK